MVFFIHRYFLLALPPSWPLPAGLTMQIHKIQIISKSSRELFLRTWIWVVLLQRYELGVPGLKLLQCWARHFECRTWAHFLLNIILWFPVGLEWWMLLLLWSYCYQSICVGSLWWEAVGKVEQQIALGAQAKDTFCFQSILEPCLVFFVTEFSISRALWRGLMTFCKSLLYTHTVVLFLSFPSALENSPLLFVKAVISGLH